MSCNSLSLQVQSVIATMLDAGVIQGALHSCSGTGIIKRHTRVLTCDEVADVVNELVSLGSIKLDCISSFTYVDGELVLVSGDGDTFSVLIDLSDDTYVSGISTEGSVITLTKNDGSIITHDLKDLVRDSVSDLYDIAHSHDPDVEIYDLSGVRTALVSGVSI